MMLRDEVATTDLLRGIINSCPNHAKVVKPPLVNDDKGVVRLMSKGEIAIICSLLAAPPHLGGSPKGFKDAHEVFEYFHYGWVSCDDCRIHALLGEICGEAARTKSGGLSSSIMFTHKGRIYEKKRKVKAAV